MEQSWMGELGLILMAAGWLASCRTKQTSQNENRYLPIPKNEYGTGNGKRIRAKGSCRSSEGPRPETACA